MWDKNGKEKAYKTQKKNGSFSSVTIFKAPPILLVWSSTPLTRVSLEYQSYLDKK